MFENYQVIIVVPAGRRRYLELLIHKIENLREVVDELRLWVNTEDQDDIEYMKKKQSDFIKLEYLKIPYCNINSIGSFFKNCIDEKTLYVRFDDDIVDVDDLESFKKFLQFRIEHPEYFLVYANILNNSITTYIHQKLGNFDLNMGIVGYNAGDILGLHNPQFAVHVHKQILSKKLKDFHFGTWILYQNEHMSINCISWLGSEFKNFNGEVPQNEEQWLSCIKPAEIQKLNCIFGGFACVHFAFYTQRGFLDNSNLLEEYLNR